jgi:hypothetical protein
LLDEIRACATQASIVDGEIWLAPDAVTDALGWHLEAQGLCRGSTCIPIRDRAALLGPHGMRLSALADVLDRPLVAEPAAHVACLGASPADRARDLRSLEAPDFTLPDLEGQPRALHEFRDRKVLLLAWASW